MKKSFLVLVALIGLISGCTHQQKGNLLIEGNVRGLRNGNLLLKQIIKDSLKQIDSIKVDGDENFVFDTHIDEPQILILELPEIKDGKILFFADQGKVSIKTTLEQFAVNPIIKAGENQKLWKEYQNIIRKFNDNNLDLIKARVEALQKKNQTKADSIDQKRISIKKRQIKYALNFIFNHKDKAIAPYIGLTEFHDNPKALDTIFGMLSDEMKESVYAKEILKLKK